MLDEKQGRSEGFKFSDMFSLQLQDQYATLRWYYYYYRGWFERAGLVERGHSLSRHELSVGQGDCVASLTFSEENVSRGEHSEKWVGDRSQ